MFQYTENLSPRETPFVNGSPSRPDAIQSAEVQELFDLANKMQKALDIRNRRRRLKIHTDCFKGSDAVDWLMQNAPYTERREAAKKAVEMQEKGLIQSVAFGSPFSDKSKELYRFSNSVNADGLSPPGISPRERPSLDADRVIHQLDSRWLKQSVVSRSVSEQKSYSSLKNQVLELESQISTLRSALENQTEMSAILLEALSAEMKRLEARTRVLYEKDTEEERTRQSDLSLVAFAGLAAAGPILSAFVTKPDFGMKGLAWIIQCLFAICFSLLLRRQPFKQGQQRKEPEREIGKSELDYGRPNTFLTAQHGRLEAAQTMHHLLDRLHALPRGSMSESSSSSDSEDDGFLSARQSQWSLGSNDQKPTVDVSFDDPKKGFNLQNIAESRSRETSEIKPTKSFEDGSRNWDEENQQAVPSPEFIKDWMDTPVMVRPKRIPDQVCHNLLGGSIPVNSGRKLQFETPLFKGCAVIWIRGLSSCREEQFSGKQRKTVLTIQGQFQKDINLDNLCTGQEFFRPLKNLPAQWLVESVLIKIARSISPSMTIGPMSSPFVLVPIVAGAQLINVAEPGNEPDCTLPEIPEDMTLFNAALLDRKGSPVSSSRRQKYFWSPENRRQMTFTREHVWTFCIYQSQVDMSKYSLNVGLQFDLSRHLDGQPLQFMMKDRDSGEYMFNFEAWHRKLLSAAERAEQTASKDRSSNAVKDRTL